MGGSALNFQRTKMAKSLLDIADLLTFVNQGWTDLGRRIKIKGGVSVHEDE